MAVILVVVAYFSIQKSQKDLLEVLRRQGIALIESLTLASQNTVRSNALVEALIDDRLTDLAGLIVQLAHAGKYSPALLKQIADQQGVERIDLFGAKKNLLTSTTSDEPFYLQQADVSALVDSVLWGYKKSIIVTLQPDPLHTEEHLALVAAAPGLAKAMVIVTSLEFLGDFRREIGIGYLIQKIGQESGIEYVVLQNPEGIVLASRKVARMPKIESDLFLTEALGGDSVRTRLTDFDGHEVLEVVRPFRSQEIPGGLFRIGLSLEGLSQTAANFRRQVLLITLVIFLIGLLVVGLGVVNRNYAALERSFLDTKGLTQTVLEAMEGAVVAIDAKGLISVFNPKAEKLFDRRAGEVTGKKYRELFPEDQFLLHQTVMTGKSTIGTERDFALSDGKRRMLVSTARLADDTGTITGAVAVLSDVTQLRKLEEEAHRAERLSALGTMAAGVAHEIRNPLNAISIAAQRLKTEFMPKEENDQYQKLTTTITTEVQRLNQTVNQFLSLARAQAVNKQKTNLAELLNEVVAVAKMEAEPKKIGIQTEWAKNLPVALDKNEMKQALLNICLNGIQAMDTGGTLAVKAGVDSSIDRQMKIEITDSGPGIAPESLSRLFQPYFTTKPGGTGLGLAIVQRIVQDHQGKIEVESQVGKGTRFVVILPVEERERAF